MWLSPSWTVQIVVIIIFCPDVDNNTTFLHGYKWCDVIWYFTVVTWLHCTFLPCQSYAVTLGSDFPLIPGWLNGVWPFLPKWLQKLECSSFMIHVKHLTDTQRKWSFTFHPDSQLLLLSLAVRNCWTDLQFKVQATSEMRKAILRTSEMGKGRENRKYNENLEVCLQVKFSSATLKGQRKGNIAVERKLWRSKPHLVGRDKQCPYPTSTLQIMSIFFFFFAYRELFFWWYGQNQ